MNKLRQASKEIHISDQISNDDKICGLHPLSRVLVTFLYLLFVVSFSNYDFIGLAGMVLYLWIQMIWYEISVRTMLRNVWLVFLFTGLIGIANPFINKEVYLIFGDITITYGMISMITLIVKGIFCVIASYILTMTAGIRQICYSLYLLHIPEEIVTIIMLMHRYLIVLLKEVEKMQQSYQLRAPKQKGIQWKTWGSFVGLLLLRSMDRAEEVYESMKLRGFHGKIQDSPIKSKKGISILYVLLWGIIFLLLRLIPIFSIVGNLF